MVMSMKIIEEIELPKNTRVASKYDRVAKELRKKIASGEYTGMLPGTKVLSEEYEVSLMTADKAVKVLEREGLVTRQSRKGTVVNASALTHTSSLAVVVRDVSLPLTSRVVGQLGKIARERNLQTLFFQHFDDVEKELSIAKELARDKQVDGVVFIGSSAGRQGVAVDIMIHAGIPVVELGMSVSSKKRGTCHFIGFDERVAFEEGTTHLIGQGHEKIGLVFPLHCEGIPVDRKYEEDPRWQGYAAAMAHAGLELQPLIWFDADKALVLDKNVAFMAAIQSCTALFAHHDSFAATILATLHRNGIHVPDDISMISYDGAPMTEALDLTTMVLPMEEVALQAAEILKECAGKKVGKPIHQIMKAEICIRGSVSMNP